MAGAFGSDAPARLAAHRSNARIRRAVLSRGYGGTRRGNGRTHHARRSDSPLARADRKTASGDFDGGRLRRARPRGKRPQRPRKGSASIALLEALQRGEFRISGSDSCRTTFTISSPRRRPKLRRDRCTSRGGCATNALLAGSGSCVFTLAPESRENRSGSWRALDLPPEYQRLTSAFAATPEWRP